MHRFTFLGRNTQEHVWFCVIKPQPLPHAMAEEVYCNVSMWLLGAEKLGIMLVKWL